MIDKIYDNYILVCDGCGETETFDNFEDALSYAKNNDWLIKKNGTDWFNYCKDCKE